MGVGLLIGSDATQPTMDPPAGGNVVPSRWPRQLQPAASRLPSDEQLNAVSVPVAVTEQPPESGGSPSPFPATTTTSTSTSKAAGGAVNDTRSSSSSRPVNAMKKTNPLNVVTLYKVNWEAFDSCDVTTGLRVGQVKSEDAAMLGTITLPSSLLSIDDNYFLGNETPLPLSSFRNLK